MGKGSGNGTTRGDRKRNARRDRLRGLLPRDGAVIGIDLAEDKQALAVIDHDVRVLARKTVKVKALVPIPVPMFWMISLGLAPRLATHSVPSVALSTRVTSATVASMMASRAA